MNLNIEKWIITIQLLLGRDFQLKKTVKFKNEIKFTHKALDLHMP